MAACDPWGGGGWCTVATGAPLGAPGPEAAVGGVGAGGVKGAEGVGPEGGGAW